MKALSPRQIQHRRKVRAKGRRHFIVYRGVLGFGAPMFISSIVWRWYDDFHWRVPAPTAGLFIAISLILLLWIAMGYFLGTITWDCIYSRTDD